MKSAFITAVGRVMDNQLLINRWLERAFVSMPKVPARLAQAMRYAVLGPGKRIRPTLCLEAFRAYRVGLHPSGAGSAGGPRTAWVSPFCCGIEMLHAFSLAHDDLPCMDDDDFRRGRPSLHRKFDEATAILAADALFALAFESFASSPAPAGQKVAAIVEIARSIGPAGMAGGQMLDIGLGRNTFRKVRSASVEVRRATSRKVRRRVHRMKTAEFIASSLVCGALVAGATGRSVARLRQAGLVLGHLFQTTDDILDSQCPRDGVNAVRLNGWAAARRQAELEAGRAERMFRMLGKGFETLAGVPRLILERRR